MTLFRSLYHQGFARIAACTLPVTLADPLKNGERVLGFCTTVTGRVWRRWCFRSWG